MVQKRVIRLDGLRFAAAMAVVMFHYAYRGHAAGAVPDIGLPGILIELSRFGYLGVSLFFMISGFVIAFSAHGRSPAEFAIARFTRLYPAFLIAMTVTFAVTLLFGAPGFSTDFAQYAANLTMFAPAFGQELMDGAYWSIILEVIFYFWVFVFLTTGQFERDCERIILIWLVISAYNEFFFQLKGLRFLLLTEFSGFFAAGILIFRLRAGLAGKGVIPLLLLSLAVSLVTTHNGLIVIEHNYAADYPDFIVLTLVVAMFGIFYASTSAAPTVIPPGLLMAAGSVTYPLYLLHQHIGYIALNRLSSAFGGIGLLLAVISMVLLMATLIWAVFERPVRPVLRRRLMALAAHLPAMRIKRRQGVLR